MRRRPPVATESAKRRMTNLANPETATRTRATTTGGTWGTGRPGGGSAAGPSAASSRSTAWGSVTAQEKEVAFTEKLEPASWNRAAVLLTPAKPETLAYLAVSISTNTVSLRIR
jgi:hypothetical protein